MGINQLQSVAVLNMLCEADSKFVVLPVANLLDLKQVRNIQTVS